MPTTLPPLFSNQLPFAHLHRLIKVHLFGEKIKNGVQLNYSCLPHSILKAFPNLSGSMPFIWVDFSGTQEDGFPVEFEPVHYPVLMRCWYHHKIHEHLTPLIRFFKTDMNHGNEYWVTAGKAPGAPHLHSFLRFRLQVTTDYEHGKPRLRVIFTGRTWLAGISVERLVYERRLDPRCLTWVVYNYEVLRYDELPEEVRYSLRKVFPVYNPGLGEVMGISPNDNPEDSSSAGVCRHLDDFFSKYLNTQSFRDIIPHTGHWLPVPGSRQFIIKNHERTLWFGQNHPDTDILHGLMSYGPASLPPCRHVRIFVICHQSDKAMAEKFIKMCCCAEGQKQITRLTRLPMVWDQTLNLVLSDLLPQEEIPAWEVQPMVPDPAQTYFAVYLAPQVSPNGKDGVFSFRYELAGQLLTRGVTLHTIEIASLNSTRTEEVLTDMAIALVVKLGGIPWHLPVTANYEIVVGMASGTTSSNPRASKTGLSQTASTDAASVFIFEATGVCRSFDVWPDPPDWLLRASLLEAITDYRKEYPHLSRVVIHYHKKIKGRISDLLDDFLGTVEHDLPVVLVGISHPRGKRIRIYNPAHAQYLPPDGTYIKIKPNTYLLFVNGNDPENHGYQTSSSLQLTIKLISNRIGYLDNDSVVGEVIQQVYKFCLINFRMKNQVRLPVSVELPDLLLSIFPFLGRLALDEEIGRTRLWFL